MACFPEQYQYLQLSNTITETSSPGEIVGPGITLQEPGTYHIDGSMIWQNTNRTDHSQIPGVFMVLTRNGARVQGMISRSDLAQEGSASWVIDTENGFWHVDAAQGDQFRLGVWRTTAGDGDIVVIGAALSSFRIG